VWSSIFTNEGSIQHLDFLTDMEKDVFKTAFEIDQRWLIEHAADRTPFVCQAQSLNVFLAADVHKKDLHQIHFDAWRKGVKSLYYCRSRSVQRAESAASWQRAKDKTASDAATAAEPSKYEECLACQ
jgi:ribonucleoside-diphosphate reductase alpha chain